MVQFRTSSGITDFYHFFILSKMIFRIFFSNHQTLKIWIFFQPSSDDHPNHLLMITTTIIMISVLFFFLTEIEIIFQFDQFSWYIISWSNRLLVVWNHSFGCFRRLHRFWWRRLQTKCVGDKFEMLVTDSQCWKNHQHNEKSRQYNYSATNISNQSPS